eukprot:1156924-Pelagomonas_calceolata.AAC.11
MTGSEFKSLELKRLAASYLCSQQLPGQCSIGECVVVQCRKNYCDATIGFAKQKLPAQCSIGEDCCCDTGYAKQSLLAALGSGRASEKARDLRDLVSSQESISSVLATAASLGGGGGPS